MSLDFSAFATVTETFAAPDGRTYTVAAPASFEAAAQFRQASFAAYKIKDDGGDHDEFLRRRLETDAVLVRACVKDPDGDRPPLAVVKGWPDRVVEALYAWIVDRSPDLVERTPESLAGEISRLTAARDRLLAGAGDPKASPSSSGPPST